MSRKLLIQIILLVLPVVLQQLEDEAKKSPSPYDDLLIQVGKTILDAVRSGQIQL